MSSKIRIIGGQWRGRKLNVPELPGLRPTGDRLRETLFNWLAPYTAAATCLDLYAGTGILGLEALSRGANYTVFVDKQRLACDQLKQNLALLKCANAEVHNIDAKIWLQNTQEQKFDLVFVDPPFADNLWQTSLIELQSSNLLARESIIYVESPKTIDILIPPDWQQLKQKVAGNICATLYASTC